MFLWQRGFIYITFVKMTRKLNQFAETGNGLNPFCVKVQMGFCAAIYNERLERAGTFLDISDCPLD